MAERDTRMPWEKGPKEAIRVGLIHGMMLGVAINLVVEAGVTVDQLRKTGTVECADRITQPVACSLSWLEQQRQRFVDWQVTAAEKKVDEVPCVWIANAGCVTFGPQPTPDLSFLRRTPTPKVERD